MKKKAILCLSVSSVILCINSIIICFERPSILLITTTIIELICSSMLIKLLIKESSSSIFRGIVKMPSVNSILKYIPGFRSGEKVNMIFAGIYYIFFIVFIIIDSFFGGKGIHAAISAIIMPFMIFSFIDNTN